MLRCLGLVALSLASVAAHGAGVWRDPNHALGDGSLAGLRFIAESPPHVLTHVENKALWPASAAQAADWPRLAEARGSQEHSPALREAPGAPAGRGLSHLVFHIGADSRRD